MVGGRRPAGGLKRLLLLMLLPSLNPTTGPQANPQMLALLDQHSAPFWAAATLLDPVSIFIHPMIPEDPRLVRWKVERQRIDHSHRPMIPGRRQVCPFLEGCHRRGVQAPIRALKDLHLPYTAGLVDERFHNELTGDRALGERHDSVINKKWRLEKRLLVSLIPVHPHRRDIGRFQENAPPLFTDGHPLILQATLGRTILPERFSALFFPMLLIDQSPRSHRGQNKERHDRDTKDFHQRIVSMVGSFRVLSLNLDIRGQTPEGFDREGSGLV